MTGSRLGCYARVASPRVSERWGPGLFHGGHMGHLDPIFRKVLRENCTKKSPGNDPQCAPCAPAIFPDIGSNPSVIIPSPKISGTSPVRCPFLYRSIVKRHTIAGSRLDRYVRAGQPPGFSGNRETQRQEKMKVPGKLGELLRETMVLMEHYHIASDIILKPYT